MTAGWRLLVGGYWLVTTGWWLLVGDCWLVTTSDICVLRFCVICCILCSNNTWQIIVHLNASLEHACTYVYMLPTVHPECLPLL